MLLNTWKVGELLSWSEKKLQVKCIKFRYKKKKKENQTNNSHKFTRMRVHVQNFIATND